MRMNDSSNILDVTPILADFFATNYEINMEDLEEYASFLDSKKDVLGLLYNYLNGQMADFEIILTHKTGKNLILEINDLSYCLMAEEFLKGPHANMTLRDLQFPFVFIFQEVVKITLNEVKPNGELCECKDFSVILQSQIMFDQLIYCDQDSIELGLAIWKYTENKGSNFLLLISAKKCQVIEKQKLFYDRFITRNQGFC